MNIAVVTGGSSGIGKEFVKQISENYVCIDEIWVIGRNKKNLLKLHKCSKKRVRTFCMDMRKKESQKNLEAFYRMKQPRIKLLVNSAGMGTIGNVEDLTMADHRAAIRLNCEALTVTTYLSLPWMHPGSRIIQMSSAAGFVPQPGFAVYAATKAYVTSFSRALRAELADRKITVTTVCPGPVDTPFFEKAERSYKMSEYKRNMMVQPKYVAQKAIRDAAVGREMSVYGGAMTAFRGLCKVVPHKLLIRATKFLNDR